MVFGCFNIYVCTFCFLLFNTWTSSFNLHPLALSPWIFVLVMDELIAFLLHHRS